MKTTPRLLAVAVALAATGPTLAADQPSGFVEGSSLDILNRNQYVHYNLRNNHDETTDDGTTDAQNYQEEWGHGVWVEYESGFTEGPVGFGVDAQAYLGIRLDSGEGTTGWGMFPVDNDGRPADHYGEMGAAAKMKIGETVAKLGEMKTDAPVFDTGDPALLPETTEGVQVISQDIENLTLEAGHYTAFNNAGSTNDDDELAPAYGSGKAGDTIDLGGATYQFSEQTSASYYWGHVDDTWNQQYANLNHTIMQCDDHSLNLDLNVYRTTDTGNSYQGEINNTSYSAALAYTMSAHTLTLAYQTIHGDTPFDYIGDDTIRLNNSMELSDFNAPNEKSFRVGYDLDLGKAVGFEGASVLASYGRGDNIDGTKADSDGGYADLYGDGGSHWERDLGFNYVVQGGTAKDLSISLLHSVHRAAGEFGEDDADEILLTVEYPIDAL